MLSVTSPTAASGAQKNNRLEIVELAALLLAYQQKTLGNKEIRDLFPNTSAKVEKPFSSESKEIAFSIGAFTSFNALVFNSLDDKDDDGVVGSEEDSLLQFTPGKAWIKYSANGEVKAKGELSLGSIGLKIDSNSSLRYNCYKAHEPTDLISEAVKKDLDDYVLISSVTNIRKNLKEHDGVSFHARAVLNTSLEIGWSDIFASNLGQIGNILKAGETFKIELGASASVGMRISLEDFFEVIIVIREQNAFEVCLQKASKKDIKGTVGAKIGVEFADQSAVNTVLAKVYEGILKVGEEEAKKLIEKINGGEDIDFSEDDLLKIQKRLGLAPEEKLDDVLEKLKKIDQQIRNTISDIAKNKVSAGFLFEYNRIKQSKSFFRATFNEAALKNYHEDLIKFNLEKVLEYVRNANEPQDVKVTTYLHEVTKTVRRGWGFGLNISKWLSFSGEKYRENETTIVRNLQNKAKLSYVGTRMYEGSWNSNIKRYGASLSAQMRSFSVLEDPLMTEQDFGLQVLMHQTERKTNQEELKDWIDQAIVWGAVNSGDFDRLYSELKYLTKQRGVSFTTQLKINHAAFLRLLPLLAEQNDRFWAGVLAASMFIRERNEVRKNMFLRKTAYDDLWYSYLVKPVHHPGFWASAAEQEITKFDKTLAYWEGEMKSSQMGNPGSFTNLVSYNGIENGIQNLIDGFKIIEKGLQSSSKVDANIEKAFNVMENFFKQQFKTRAFGRALIEYASTLKIREGIEKTFIITYKEDRSSEERVISISQA